MGWCRPGRSDRGSRVFKSPLLQVVGFESLESFSVFSFPFPLLQVRAKVSNAKEGLIIANLSNLGGG